MKHLHDVFTARLQYEKIPIDDICSTVSSNAKEDSNMPKTQCSANNL